MWTYQQHNGNLLAPDGSFEAAGYSGHGAGVNNPVMQNQSNIGPIPQGLYTIGTAYSDSEKGPLVMPLTPDPSNQMYGRSGFLIHGDLVGEVGKDLASDGCIIMPHDVRQTIAESLDRLLQVVA